jgi:AcrR family transcriptional regulator
VATKNTEKRPKGPGRLSAEQAADLPARLLDAAESLFTEKGYSGTSMENIARQAGASTKTIYSRFTDKTEILQAVVRRLVDRTVEAHKAQMVVAPRDADPQRFLATLGAQISLTIGGRGAGLNRLVLSEAHQHPALADLYRLVVGHGTGLIREVLTQWKADGLFTNMPDVDKAAALCLIILADHARVRSALGIPLQDDECKAFVSYAVEIFLRGCGYTPKPHNKA